MGCDIQDSVAKRNCRVFFNRVLNSNDLTVFSIKDTNVDHYWTLPCKLITLFPDGGSFGHWWCIALYLIKSSSY